jgi:hypothetical protein
MNQIARFAGRLLAGLGIGIAVVFLAVVGAVAFAYATGTDVLIPGVFEGWFTQENGLPALNFRPNGIGIVVVVVVIAGLFAVLGLRRKRVDDPIAQP